ACPIKDQTRPAIRPKAGPVPDACAPRLRRSRATFQSGFAGTSRCSVLLPDAQDKRLPPIEPKNPHSPPPPTAVSADPHGRDTRDTASPRFERPRPGLSSAFRWLAARTRPPPRTESQLPFGELPQKDG